MRLSALSLQDDPTNRRASMDQALSAHCGSRVAKSKNRLSGDHPIQSIPAGDLKRERDDLIKSERSNPSGFFN